MPDTAETLSDRELDVLQCVVRGATNREIALDLNISPNTVKVHLRNIYAKLGVSSRTEAVHVAVQQGFVTLPGAPTAVPLAPEAAAPVSASDDGVGAPPPLETAAATVAPAWWRHGALLGALVILLGLAGLGAWSLWRGGAAAGLLTPTPVPFVETPLGATRWRATRPLPAPRAGMALAAVGLNVYEIGGDGPDGVVGGVRFLETDTLVWRDGAPKLTAVTGATAAVLGGEIYVPGGWTAAGQPTAVVDVYSPANDAWRRVADLPRPIGDGLALSDGRHVYHIGGDDGDGPLALVFRFDPADGRWLSMAPLATPRAGAAGGVIGGRLYVVGGRDASGALAACEVYTPVEDAWETCPAMSAARVDGAAVAVLDKLYVLGGGDDEAAYGEVYDSRAERWEAIDMPAADVAGRTDMGVANIETRIYTIGGRRGTALAAETYVYAPFTYQFFIPIAPNAGPPADGP